MSFVTVMVLFALFVFIIFHAVRFLTAATPYRLSVERLPASCNVGLVSFLVPAWNDGRHIAEFVESFNALTYPDKELILCAGGSDGSFQQAQRYSSNSVKVIEQRSGEGKQSALRKSYALSKGDVIYLTDIDCRLSDDIVHALLNTLTIAHPVVTGPIRPLQSQEDIPFVQIQWAVGLVTQPKTASPTQGLLGGNTVMMRDPLNNVGAFDEDVASGTDYFLAKKFTAKGISLFFQPSQPIHTEYPETLTLYSRKQARWIRNVFILGKRFSVQNDVRASIFTMSLPVITLLCLIIAIIASAMGLGAASDFCWIISTILVLHPVLNRLRYQYSAGLPLNVGSATAHWLGAQMSAARAIQQIVSNKWKW